MPTVSKNLPIVWLLTISEAADTPETMVFASADAAKAWVAEDQQERADSDMLVWELQSEDEEGTLFWTHPEGTMLLCPANIVGR